MTAAELRAAIRAQTALIVKRITNTTVRGYCGVIDGLADQIPALLPSIVERRRAGRERRERDMAFQGPGRRVGQRRGAVRQYPTSAVVVVVDITSASPPNFAPTDTYQLEVSVQGDIWTENQDGSASVARTTLTGRTITYATSDAAKATVDSNGLVTAVATGSATITATCEGVSDTLSLVVTSPQNAVSSVTLSPTSGTVTVGNGLTFAATVKDASNNILTGKTVTWNSSDTGKATVGADSGTEAHTATVTGVAAGSTNIKATCETVDSSLAAVTVEAASARYPNEPAGYTRFMAHELQALPTTANAIAGSWGTWRSSDVTLVADGTDPDGDGNVLRVRFPAGLVEGNAPSCGFGGWATGSVQKSAIYFSATIKVEGATWEGSSSEVNKLLGWFSYGRTDGANNESTLALMGAGSRSSFTLQLRQQNLTTRELTQNVDGTAYLTTDAWHQVELVMLLNTVGSSNGTFRAWIDGVKTHEYTNVLYRTPTYTAGFRYYQLDPTWGGSNQYNTVDTTQYVRYGSIYLSGINL